MNMLFFRISTFVFLPILLSGCTKYQYVTIDSNVAKNDRREFVIENDTFRINYNFNGWNGPLHISIFNKGDQPLFIDWKKSAVILDGQKVSLWKDETSIEASIRGFEINWNDFSSNSYADLDGKMTRPEAVSFIPPNSGTKFTPLSLKNKFIPFDPDQKVVVTRIPTNQGYLSAKMQQFNPDQSPLGFRSFITLSTEEEFKEPIYRDDYFWVADFTEAMYAPRVMSRSYGDQYYVQKNTSFGKIGFGALAILLLTGYLLASTGSGG